MVVVIGMQGALRSEVTDSSGRWRVLLGAAGPVCCSIYFRCMLHRGAMWIVGSYTPQQAADGSWVVQTEPPTAQLERAGQEPHRRPRKRAAVRAAGPRSAEQDEGGLFPGRPRLAEPLSPLGRCVTTSVTTSVTTHL